MPTALNSSPSRPAASSAPDRNQSINVEALGSVEAIKEACGNNTALLKAKLRAFQEMRLAKLDPNENLKALIAYIGSDAFSAKLSGALSMGGDVVSEVDFVRDLKAYLEDTRLDSWEKMAKSSPEVLESACLNIAAMGLSPNHLLGYAFLMPSFSPTEGIALSPVPGVRGMEKAVMSTGEVKSIDRGIIRDQDDYDFQEGDQPFVRVKKRLRIDNEKPNPIIGAWAVVDFKDGVKIVNVTPIKESNLKRGYMGVEKAAEYTAERAVLRVAMQTKLQSFDVSDKYLTVLNDSSLNEEFTQEVATAPVQTAAPQVQAEPTPAQTAAAPTTKPSLIITPAEPAAPEIEAPLSKQAVATAKQSALLEEDEAVITSNKRTGVRR